MYVYLFTLQPRMFFMWCEARSGQRQSWLEFERRIWRVFGGDVKDIVPFVPIAQVSMLNSRHKKTLVPQPVVAFLSSTCLGFEVGPHISKTGEVFAEKHYWLDQTVSCSSFLLSVKPLGSSILTFLRCFGYGWLFLGNWAGRHLHR